MELSSASEKRGKKQNVTWLRFAKIWHDTTLRQEVRGGLDESGGRAKRVAAGTVADRLGCVVRGTILHEVVHCVIAQLPTVVGRTCALGGVGVKPAATLGRAENSTTS